LLARTGQIGFWVIVPTFYSLDSKKAEISLVSPSTPKPKTKKKKKGVKCSKTKIFLIADGNETWYQEGELVKCAVPNENGKWVCSREEDIAKVKCKQKLAILWDVSLRSHK
jgi:hypothetical protein